MMTATAIRHCPAILISTLASRQGKTRITALAYYHRLQNRKAQVFK